jgi:hypothetical protein
MICSHPPRRWPERAAASPAGGIDSDAHDLALCELDEPLETEPLARVAVLDAQLPPGTELRILGFGCGTDEQARSSCRKGRVTGSNPEEPATRPGTLEIETRACYGDSGAGAYLLVDGQDSWTVVGVVSHSDLDRFTYVVPLASSGFREWATAWSAERGVTICGLQGEGAGACTKPTDSPDSPPILR